ncbi:hypothetical protein SD961_06560 [Erwinia sp. MMLR14_017]|uniref:hypothetical protein n=1 Tax=Erwinia sp. MMLR14_017 TaxID=3093842 RepID=UPI0029903F7D|nr:hypothetical protein [Erwinia sp. MMLR14_017]MDW8845562.1 hypothetical protein [Erwinia sp. MMLR14_017]
MEVKDEKVVSLFPASGNSDKKGGDGGGTMNDLIKRVEKLEADTHQIKLDLAILTTRSENFVTKADLTHQLSLTESRISGKIDSINNRIIWTHLVPALVGIILWFVKVAILKI